jgi:hypothetical protein
LAPLNVVVLVWQVSHAALVTMCVFDWPLAVVPLWQDAQPVVMPAWLILAPVKVVVLVWQVSHAALVTMCVFDWPLAVAPLWQVAQLPVTPS